MFTGALLLPATARPAVGLRLAHVRSVASARDLAAALAARGAMLVDLRSVDERATSPVAARAVRIEWDRTMRAMATHDDDDAPLLPRDKAAPIVLH